MLLVTSLVGVKVLLRTAARRSLLALARCNSPHPIGALGGILAWLRPDDMAALGHRLRNILARNQFDPALVEEVFFHCANQAGEDNRNVARMAALLSGLPLEVGGVTVNRLCASGLNAIQ